MSRMNHRNEIKIMKEDDNEREEEEEKEKRTRRARTICRKRTKIRSVWARMRKRTRTS